MVGVYGLSFEVMLLFTIKKPANVISPVDYSQERISQEQPGFF